MKTLLEKCESFLDAIPLELVHEFENKYCPGQMYHQFMIKMPDEFVQSALNFSMSHMDNTYFQSAAIHHLGSLKVRTGLLSDKKAETITANKNGPNGVRKPVPVQQKTTGSCRFEPNKPSEPDPEPRHKTHSQLFGPVCVHTDDELRKSIARKLFGELRNHDRYTRLTPEEKRLILRYAGLSKKERDIFEEKCDRHYFPYWKIANRLGVSESLIKKRAVRIDEQIRRMLEN